MQLSRVPSRLAPARGPRTTVTAALKTLDAPVTSTALTVLRPLVQAEKQVLDALSTARGRGASGLTEAQRTLLQRAVEVLERDGGLAAPTTQAGLNGKWRLLYTSRPGTASPIQNTFTGVDAFSVFQEVQLDEDEYEGGARVNNIVDFGESIGFLKVEAEASTESRPLPDFEPRSGEGLALFGKSSSAPAVRPDMRIDFGFDQAAFQFTFLPFKVPYPVPFRLLGDERKGWLDVTYLSRDCSFRLSRGNKGTLFILSKEVPVRDRLMAAIQSGEEDEVLSCVEQLQSSASETSPAESDLAAGCWRLLWSQQAPNASALQKWGTKQARSYQIVEADPPTLQNRVELTPWLRVIADATISVASPTRTGVDITSARIELGPFIINLPRPSGEGRNPGFIDWLYLDEDVRITRGNLGSLFIHERADLP